MKILRIDNQDCCSLAVFNNLDELREQLIDFHSIDYDDHFDENEKYKSIMKSIYGLGTKDRKILGEGVYYFRENEKFCLKPTYIISNMFLQTSIR